MTGRSNEAIRADLAIVARFIYDIRIRDHVARVLADIEPLLAERDELRGECERLRRDWDTGFLAVRDQRDDARAELARLRQAVERVRSLCDVVRRLQDPDPDTGDRAVSFFALLDALDPDGDALTAVPEDGTG